MTADERDPQLQALFAAQAKELPAEPFTANIVAEVNRRRRRAIVWRVLIALTLALLSIPLKDVALQFTQLLVVALVEIENQLVAQLLAPINTVGGLLSVTLLLMRAAHRRLFT